MVEFRVAVKSFIINDNNELLILKRSKDAGHMAEIWEIPGGRLELGEDPLEGIKRETQEETGLSIDVLHPLTVRHFTRKDGQIINLISFLCKLKENNTVSLSKEHTDHKWVKLSNEEDLKKYFEDGFYMKEVRVFRDYFSGKV